MVTLQKRRLLLGILALVTLCTAALALGRGPVNLSPLHILQLLWEGMFPPASREASELSMAIVWDVRMPRVLMGLLVGAALALAGAVLQGLFRNPLADPSLIGVSNGAALGSILSILLIDLWFPSVGRVLGSLQLPLFGFAGGLAATLLVYQLGRIGGKIFVAAMLLAGIAVNALCMALMGYVIYLADDNQLRTITFWTMGSLAHSTWKTVGLIVPFLLLPVIILPFFSKALNGLLLGENEARHLGFHPERTKRLCVILTAAAIGGAVSISGVIGFVGLVVPHVVRLLLGPDNRGVLWGSALLGAALLVLGDLFARTIAAPAELPLGVVTSSVGAPFFIYLLLRSRKDYGF